MKNELTIEEAKRQIEELQRYIQAKKSEQPKGITLHRIDGTVIAETYKSILKEAIEANKDNLWRADLSGADLWGADLLRADLRGADLRGADLSGADLRGADLSGADLSGADLSGADLREVKIKRTQMDVLLKAMGVIVEDE